MRRVRVLAPANLARDLDMPHAARWIPCKRHSPHLLLAMTMMTMTTTMMTVGQRPDRR
jgi:hypothetical protein